MYRWEFERDGEPVDVAVPGTVTIDQTRTGLALVRGGAGLMYAPEPMLAPLVEAEAVVPVLQDWWPAGPGFHVYYSGRRQLPVGLRLLIDLVRDMRPLGL